MITSLLHDFQLSLRRLRESPGFAVVSDLTPALGIAGSTAIFSIVNSAFTSGSNCLPAVLAAGRIVAASA
jgi:hypothetical protein